MSKNQKTYLLLLAVLLVWGAVGYRIYLSYNPDQPEEQSVSPVQFTPIKTEKSLAYTITPDYRDPFLGKIYKKKVAVKKAKTALKPVVTFPNITYHGVIKGEKKAYIISIDGKQEIFQLKQAFKGVLLVKASDKEVSLKYQGEVKKYLIIQ